MPVLSETFYSTTTLLPSWDSPSTYLFLFAFLLLTWTLISRKSKSSTTQPLSKSPETSSYPAEKSPLHLSDVKPRIQRPSQPPPFTPPTLYSPHQPLPPPGMILPLQTAFPFEPVDSTPLNADYYNSPVEMEYSTSTSDYSDFPPMERSTATRPSRRSYTKTLSQSSTSSSSSTTSSSSTISLQGEIIQGENWRRHTRVFGGGVCKACEESERRMSA